MTKCMVFGCEQVTVDFIRYLKTLDDVEIPMLVTREFVEDALFKYDSVVAEGKKLGIEVIDSPEITESLTAKIEKIRPDIIFSTFYRCILPPRVLKIPPLGCFNLHGGKLPDYKGFAPTTRALINGESHFGLTLHTMEPGIDTGDIVIQELYPIEPDETGFELHVRAARLGAKLLCDNFHKILRKETPSRKQKDGGAYFGALDVYQTADWKLKADTIRNLVRANAKPYHPLQSPILNKFVFINRVRTLDDERHSAASPGEIVELPENGNIIVACGGGQVILEDYEFAPSFTPGEKAIYLQLGNKFGKAHY